MLGRSTCRGAHACLSDHPHPRCALEVHPHWLTGPRNKCSKTDVLRGTGTQRKSQVYLLEQLEKASEMRPLSWVPCLCSPGSPGRRTSGADSVRCNTRGAKPCCAHRCWERTRCGRWGTPRESPQRTQTEPCKEIVDEATDFCGHIQLIKPRVF